jgi:hypothetical protein
MDGRQEAPEPIPPRVEALLGTRQVWINSATAGEECPRGCSLARLQQIRGPRGNSKAGEEPWALRRPFKTGIFCLWGPQKGVGGQRMRLREDASNVLAHLSFPLSEGSPSTPDKGAIKQDSNSSSRLSEITFELWCAGAPFAGGCFSISWRIGSPGPLSGNAVTSAAATFAISRNRDD